MYNRPRFSSKGVTIIEILCFIVIVGTIFALTAPAFQSAYNNGASILLALFFAGIVFVCVTCIIFFTLWMFSLFLRKIFPSSPDYCESKKCYLNNCYRVRLGLLDRIYSIIYYKCQCGNEYVRYGCDFFAKVENDGTLKPYIYRWKWWGWYQDRRTNSDVYKLKIPQEVLKLLRQRCKSDSFVHTIEKGNSNILVLNTMIDLRKKIV